MGPRVKAYVALMRYFRAKGMPKLAKFVSARLQIAHGVFISAQAEIAPNVKFPHPTGIVIGDGVKIAANVTIYQNVTLGAARSGERCSRRYPEICSDVVVFAGATVVGAVTVGTGAVVGASAVVIKDVPAGATVVGSPAQVVSQKGESYVGN
tara:strand:+ start:559 stop:1014 length:456 start_codon:yes stop_codon:yes gene_type:complete